jgi:hypothetical protein
MDTRALCLINYMYLTASVGCRYFRSNQTVVKAFGSSRFEESQPKKIPSMGRFVFDKNKGSTPLFEANQYSSWAHSSIKRLTKV